ncbi:phosphocholine cytidylyltransferase family protein [Breznakiella homolactica]|uniref:Phosphocholine cytidylyltransferase family protein n=1 Tax=Breznakiella homolactica TaxID=2798577 RepID=A0A7T7XPB5_9SPIR|nr:phosphocholine cytidylyltransferase family protein [Breznakiella homolactica]QQO10021.1 phosphocholine cytidylyltransferase family protein [Breznakiella homolactica]
MDLSRNQFDVLTFLEKTHETKDPTQRAVARGTGLSLGTVNKTIFQLTELDFLDGLRVSQKGLKALEPYRVKRAVFIAAGFGSRMVPVTLNTPKALIRVKGVRIIDSLLDAVVAAGIEEIVLVRGYLREQFDQLLLKYPMISFFENPSYNESNNISSATCVRNLLKNAYVFEGDLLLKNPKLITKYQYTSNYLGVPVEVTDDWCFETKNGIITKIKVGGRSCYRMFGISYWNETDGAKLAEHIKQVYEMPGGKERYWDQVPLEYHIKDYKVEIRECTVDDITEINTFSELRQLDETYRV